MKGLINLYKPSGFTSSDAVVKVKKILNEHTVGHMGTLDPMGEGVLPLGVGKAARLFEYYLKKDKLYKATFRFGFETDTLDRCGVVIHDGGNIPTFEEIQKVACEFVGKIEQIPPKYSAKSVNGRKAYKMARDGENFILNPVSIEIYSIESEPKGCDVEFTVSCSAGTYIRALGRDIAYKLNTYATMTDITRLKSGNFRIENSVTLEEVEKLKDKALIPIEEALIDTPRIDIPSDLYDKLNNGIKLSVTPFDTLHTVFCRGELFGLGVAPFGILKIVTYLKD